MFFSKNTRNIPCIHSAVIPPKKIKKQKIRDVILFQPCFKNNNTLSLLIIQSTRPRRKKTVLIRISQRVEPDWKRRKNKEWNVHPSIRMYLCNNQTKIFHLKRRTYVQSSLGVIYQGIPRDPKGETGSLGGLEFDVTTHYIAAHISSKSPKYFTIQKSHIVW